jgi:hypothetical protein
MKNNNINKNKIRTRNRIRIRIRHKKRHDVGLRDSENIRHVLGIKLGIRGTLGIEHGNKKYISVRESN